MMPEIVFLIPIVAIVGWVLTEISSHLFEYMSRSEEAEGLTLTSSELEALIAAAVEEANRELCERVDELETELEAARQRPLLDEPADANSPPLDETSRAPRHRVG